MRRRHDSSVLLMVMDERAEKLADLVLRYSISTKKGDQLLIQSDPVYTDYATLLGNKAKTLGAEVKYDFISHNPKILRRFLERMDMSEWDEELKRITELSMWCNSRILLNNDSDPNYAEGIPDFEKRIAEFNKKVIGPYKKVLYRELDGDYFVKWNIVEFPSQTSAEFAGMSLDEYADFVYGATLGEGDPIEYWNIMEEDMRKVKTVFDDASTVRIVVPGLTDLTFSLKGRNGALSPGKHNMPSGEVYYGPVENSANGVVYFQIPTRRNGLGVIEGIKLEFENGEVVSAYADKNQKALDAMLDVDGGVKKIGEFGIGCNHGIKKAVLETLFDEKIGGTIHLALGGSLSENLQHGGGLNESEIHWDLICDLRKNLESLDTCPGGEIYVDDKLVQKDGYWIS